MTQMGWGNDYGQFGVKGKRRVASGEWRVGGGQLGVGGEWGVGRGEWRVGWRVH
jgi:hypothetical protein